MDSTPEPDEGAEDISAEQPPASGRTQSLKWVAGLAVIGAVALLAVFSGGGTAEADSVTELVFINQDGSTGTLADFQGEPLVVNFFASWCAPCRAELPDLEAVHVAGGGEVQFVGVNHDIDQSSWLSLINEVGLTYPTVFQPEQEIWETLNLFGMPATVFMSADGEVVYTFSGVLNQEVLKELIAEHLAVEV